MKVQCLGHAVLKVRDQERAEAFYHGILGLPIAARHPVMPMTFFTLGNHHDLAILAVGADAPPAPRESPGLYHIALKVGESLDELREARAHLQANGVRIISVIDHTVSQSLYLKDPDGNGIELYVDGAAIWRDDPQRVADGVPLEL